MLRRDVATIVILSESANPKDHFVKADESKGDRIGDILLSMTIIKLSVCVRHLVVYIIVKKSSLILIQ